MHFKEAVLGKNSCMLSLAMPTSYTATTTGKETLKINQRTNITLPSHVYVTLLHEFRVVEVCYVACRS